MGIESWLVEYPVGLVNGENDKPGNTVHAIKGFLVSVRYVQVTQRNTWVKQ